MPMGARPLVEMTVELVRGAGPEAAYTLRYRDLERGSASFPRNGDLDRDLEALRGPTPAPLALQRVGLVFRDFFDRLGWELVEADLTKALATQEVLLTIRCLDP